MALPSRSPATIQAVIKSDVLVYNFLFIKKGYSVEDVDSFLKTEHVLFDGKTPMQLIEIMLEKGKTKEEAWNKILEISKRWVSESD